MKIYTDGSFNKKLSKDSTAYAAVIILNESQTHYEVDIVYGVSIDPNYTNMWNVGGEIWGVLSGIDYVIEKYNPKNIEIYHDYIGLSKWISGEWKAKNQATSSYVNYIKNIMNDRTVTFIRVPGHSNNQLNDLADEYANCATKKYLNEGKQINLVPGLRILKK